MGDGGFIMQLTDMRSGNVVAVSNDNWRCLVINKAPLDKACEKDSNPVPGTSPCDFTSLPQPQGWKTITYNDSAWNDVTRHAASDVGPKDGYDAITWDAAAQLIWGPDLETDNTILCRITVDSP